MAETTPAFLKRDWCRMNWSEWVPFDPASGPFFKIPNGPEAYTCSTSLLDQPELAYVGETVSLRGRLQALRRHTFARRGLPSNDPHTAAPSLWVLRQHGFAFACSAASSHLGTRRAHHRRSR